MKQKKHTFAICAYKESAFLEECILSLKKQERYSEIFIVTSTPNIFINSIAKKYQLPVFVNDGESGIVQDWNFGYEKAETPYVTIAHQDDIYFEEYAKQAIESIEKMKKPLLYFTDYAEIRKGKEIRTNQLLKIKRMMLWILRFKWAQRSRFIRRRILSLGSPICCPSVTLIKKELKGLPFAKGFRSDEDWEAWEKISRQKGAFIYNKQILMGHRIHGDSETTAILGDLARSAEDYEMFCKFWPKPIAKILTKVYSTSENSNRIDE